MGTFVLDQDLHHHSKLSACSRDELQTPAAILKTAKRLGITSLCLTDHYWDRAVEGRRIGTLRRILNTFRHPSRLCRRTEFVICLDAKPIWIST